MSAIVAVNVELQPPNLVKSQNFWQSFYDTRKEAADGGKFARVGLPNTLRNKLWVEK